MILGKLSPGFPKLCHPTLEGIKRNIYPCGSGSNGNGDPHNGAGGDVTSPNRHSIGYRPRQRQPSSDAPGRTAFALLTTIRQNFELVKSRTFCQCMFFTSFWHMPLMSSKEESGVVEQDGYLPTQFLKI